MTHIDPKKFHSGWSEETVTTYTIGSLPDYKVFKKRMKILKKSLVLIRFLEKGIEALDEYNQQPDFGGYLLDQYVQMLSETVGDENDLVSWYVWENDFGAKGLKGITSIKKLFNFIIQENSRQ